MVVVATKPPRTPTLTADRDTLRTTFEIQRRCGARATTTKEESG